MTDLAVIYCRKSDPNAKSNDPSFEDQEKECRKYCEDKGYVVLCSRREAYTGTDLEHQKELLASIDDIKTGRAKVIVSWSTDRLSRDPTMQTVALYDIENKYGGRFEAVTDQFDRNNPMFVALRAMFGVADGIERKHVTERMQRGKVGRSQRGALYGAGNAKYGFRWADDEPGERTKFMPDEQAATTIRRIFDWFDNGKSIRWIARQLNSEGIATPSQAAADQGHLGERRMGGVWYGASVLRVLREPAYCGKMDAFRSQTSYEYVKNPTTGIMEKKLVLRIRDENDPARIQLTCPAIVTVDQWNRVQERLANNKNKEGQPPVDPEEAVMRGHVYCGCGHRMFLVRVRKADHYYYLYRCNAHASNATDPSLRCPYGDQGITANQVNQFGIYMAMRLAEKKGVLQEFLQGKDHDNEPLRQMTAKLTALVQRKTAERDKYLEGVGTAKASSIVAVLVEKAEQAGREVEDAQAKLAEATKRLHSVDQRRASFDQVITKIAFITPEGIHEMSPDELRALFDLIGLRVNVYPVGSEDRLVAEYNLRGTQSPSSVADYM